MGRLSGVLRGDSICSSCKSQFMCWDFPDNKFMVVCSSDTSAVDNRLNSQYSSVDETRPSSSHSYLNHNP